MVRPHTIDLILQIGSSLLQAYHIDLHTRALTNEGHTNRAFGAFGCIHLCHSASAVDCKSVQTPLRLRRWAPRLEELLFAMNLPYLRLMACAPGLACLVDSIEPVVTSHSM